MTIEQKIANRLFADYQANLTWAQMVAAVQASDQTDKDYLVEALSTARIRDVGRKLQQVVMVHLRGLALTEATQMLDDDVIDRTELDKII